MNFCGGFEKEAKLKHWLAAAALAGSPAKAKAGENMAESVGKAVRATSAGRALESNVNKAVEKARNIKLFGGESAGVGKGGGAASAQKAKPSLSLHDGSKLQLDYGKFHARAKRGETGASFDLSKTTKIDVADNGREKSFRIGFEKDF